MYKALSISTILCAGISGQSASANETHDHSQHSSGSHHHQNHFHKAGEIMTSYSYEGMLMKGMKDGDSSITPSEVVDAGGDYQYQVSPTRMTMEMHMLGAMYGLTDDITLMGMAHYMEKDMDMVNRAGVDLKANSQGFGDTEVSAMIKLDEDESSLLWMNAGLSLPTGATDFKGTRMGSYDNLPIAMQLGSGTYDPILGITYSAVEDGFSWGADANAKFRLGLNDEGYRLGDEFTVSSWVAHDLTDYATASLRLEGKTVGNVKGEDSRTSAISTTVSTADTSNYGGQSVNLAAGVNLLADEIGLENHSFLVEYELPIYQNLNGPQLGVQHSITANWQVTF